MKNRVDSDRPEQNLKYYSCIKVKYWFYITQKRTILALCPVFLLDMIKTVITNKYFAITYNNIVRLGKNQ